MGARHVVGRFAVGAPISGQRKTDATFWRTARTELHHAQPMRWSYLPGWQRAGARWGVLLGLAFGAWAYLTHPVLTLAVLAILALSGAAWAAWRAQAAWRVRQHRARYVKPLDAVLRPLFGLPPTVSAADYIRVPTTFAIDEDTPARITLPAAFQPTNANKGMLEDIVLPKLGRSAQNTDTRIESVGVPVMVCKLAPQPPDVVGWSSVVEQMRGLKRGQILLGLGPRGNPFIRDLINGGEAPHWAFSCGSGMGKSTFLCSVAAQVLHQDAEAHVLGVDPKQTSFASLFGTPGLTLANDPDDVEGMWALIEGVEAEMDRRRALRAEDPTVEFALHVLLIDELSEFADMTADHWDEIKGKKDKKIAPVWKAIRRVLRLGREFMVRLIAVTQRLDSDSTGGRGLRDLFGFRGLAGFRPNQWLMLVGTRPIPASSSHVGRWIFDDLSTQTWVQTVYGKPDQLKAWALDRQVWKVTPAGVEDVATDVSQVGGAALSSGQMPSVATCDMSQVREPGAPGTAVIVGLEAGAAAAGLSVDAFRQRRVRAGGTLPGELREGNRPAWWIEDLEVLRPAEAPAPVPSGAPAPDQEGPMS